MTANEERIEMPKHEQHGKHPKLEALESQVRDGEIDTLVVAHHRHAGPARRQARPGPGVPGRRHRPRRALLHLPAGHRHGDGHARGLRADELGDRLRRLDRRARSGTRCASLPVAREDRARARRRRSTRRTPRRSRSARARSSSARSSGPRRWASPSRPAPSSSTTCSRTRGRSLAEQAAGRSPSAFGYYNEDYHLLQATKAEPLHRLLRNQMTAGPDPDRVQQGRGGARPARGQHPLRPCARVGGPDGASSSTAPRRSPTSTAGASRSWPSPTTAGPARRAIST